MASTYPTHFSHLGGFPSQNISLALHAPPPELQISHHTPSDWNGVCRLKAELMLSDHVVRTKYFLMNSLSASEFK